MITPFSRTSFVECIFERASNTELVREDALHKMEKELGAAIAAAKADGTIAGTGLLRIRREREAARLAYDNAEYFNTLSLQ
jgi:hypothetical protein